MIAVRRQWLVVALLAGVPVLRIQAVKPRAAVAVLWRNPVDIGARDLYFGPGGKAHQPRPPFLFIEEDARGTNPKFVVKDGAGVLWTIKLGAEAKAETAASRIIWAAGYFANEDYYLAKVNVRNMAKRLHRGSGFVAHDGTVRGARLKRRAPEFESAGTWRWSDSPFRGTRQLNGLRTLMALINNWDLTDENNAILIRKGSGERIYLVSDAGASFGTGDLTWPLRRARGDLGAYSHSEFVSHESAQSVDFRVPSRPAWFFLFTPREYTSKLRLRWIGRGIPREDARWMGEILAGMSPRQLRDAFRAAGYSQEEAQLATRVIERRIADLRSL